MRQKDVLVEVRVSGARVDGVRFVVFVQVLRSGLSQESVNGFAFREYFQWT